MTDNEKLKALTEIAGAFDLDEQQWFLDGLRELAGRWDHTLYKKMLAVARQNNFGPVPDTVFAVPKSREDLDAVDGPYKIGKFAHAGTDFGLTPDQLQMHGLVVGGAGYGKSTLVTILSQQLLAEGKIKVWIIDPKEGGDHRCLARQFSDVLILRPHVLRCNPFAPIPHVPHRVLRENATETTSGSLGVYDAPEGMMIRHVQAISERHGTPCILDLIASLNTEKPPVGGRRQEYLDSLNTSLLKTQISLGEIIDCREDYFSQLYNHNVIFEVGALSGMAQRVLVPWIIMKLTLFKMKNPTPALSHLLIFDEAQSLESLRA